MWRRARVALAVLFAVFSISGSVAKADVNNFTIASFDGRYVLTRDDPQGKLDITEKINVHFTDQNHGILRAIPMKNGPVNSPINVIEVKRDGIAESYTTYEENNNQVLKIGSASFTITGDHQYEIHYTVSNVIRFFDDHDELYWNINGTQWQQPFLKISASIVPPEEQPFSASPPPACYTGRAGSTESNCQFNPPKDGVGSSALNLETTKALGPNENLTFVGAFPKDYFTPPTTLDKAASYLWLLPTVIFIGLQSLIVFFAYRKWRKFGKDYPKPKVVAPAFGPPRDVGVLVSGYVYSNTLENRTITAGLIDLAVRKYIKIIETDEKALFGKSTKYEIELTKSPLTLNALDQSLLGMFLDLDNVGGRVALDKKLELYKVLPGTKKKVAEKADKMGFYEVSPEKTSSKLVKYIGWEIVLLFLAFILRPAAIFTGFAFVVVIVILQSLMSRRSLAGVEIQAELEGLKLYLSTAEKDRLKLLQGANAPLAENAKEPVRDVKLFEKLLPYAIIFGVEKTWADSFKDIYTESPDWYQGNWTAFNTGYLVGSIGNTVSAVGTSFSAPSSSGGSGFSGGGSGGGGGGGGGGGW